MTAACPSQVLFILALTQLLWCRAEMSTWLRSGTVHCFGMQCGNNALPLIRSQRLALENGHEPSTNLQKNRLQKHKQSSLLYQCFLNKRNCDFWNEVNKMNPSNGKLPTSRLAVGGIESESCISDLMFANMYSMFF